MQRIGIEVYNDPNLKNPEHKDLIAEGRMLIARTWDANREGNNKNGGRMVAGKHSWQEPGRSRRRASGGAARAGT